MNPNVLIYATGALAYADVSYSANHDFPGIQYPVSFSTTKVGWALGGGVEYALCKNWTIKAEYLYIDLRSESAIANPIPPNPPFQQASQWETTTNIFQIGVNYKF